MLMPIAECRDIELYVDEVGFFSFTNSPYYAHRHLASVDLYPERGVKEAYSPVEGRVLEARKLKVMEDYFIAIEAGKSGACVKILHVKPEVDVGERVRPGDILGNLVWSPFYSYWTDPHMHVEIRPIDDRLRARGGYRLNLAPLIKRIRFDNNVCESFLVEKALDRYTLLRPALQPQSFLTPLILNFHGVSFMLEGGLTHYGHGALWTEPKELPQEALECLKELFQIDFMQRQYIHFTCQKQGIVLKGFEYKGIGLYLNDPQIKLIPKKIGGGRLEVGDKILLNEILPFVKAFRLESR
jgi:hypothetical protein